MNERALIARFGVDLSQWEKDLIKASKGLKDFAGELTGLGKTLTASVTAPLTAVGVASVAASETVDDAMDRIRIGTGATGDNLTQLGDTFRAVFTEVPESAANVSTAITELSKRSGMMGDELKAGATQMLELARVSGEDVKPLIESTQKAFASWGVETKNQASELDFLWKVSQQTGVGVGELAGTMASSGATLRALGVDFETGAAMIGQFQKAGVDSGTVLAGLTKGASEFAKEGKSMSDGLKETVEAIKGTSDPAAAAQIAIDTFGKSGIAMADAIRKGGLDVEGFVAKLRQSPETIHRVAEDTAGLGEAFGILQNKATSALEPIGTAITKVLIDVMNVAGKLVDNVVKPVTAAFGALPEPIQSAIVVMAGIAAAIGPALIAIGGLITTIGGIGTSLIAAKATAGAAIAGLTTLFPAAGATITAAWGGVTAAFAGTGAAAAAAVGGVGAIGSALVSFAVPAAAAVAAVALIVKNWDFLKEKLGVGASLIKEGFSATWTAVSSLASSAWDSISTTVGAAVKGVVSGAVQMGADLMAAAKSGLGPYYDALVAGIGRASSYASEQWETLKLGAAEVASTLSQSMSGAAQSVAQGVSQMREQFAQAVEAANGTRDALAAASRQGTFSDGSNFSGLGAGSAYGSGAAITSSVSGSLLPGGDGGIGGMISGGRQGGAKDIIIGGQTTGGFGSSGVRELTDFTGTGDSVIRGAGSGGAGDVNSYSGPPVISNQSPYLAMPSGYGRAAGSAFGGVTSSGGFMNDAAPKMINPYAPATRTPSTRDFSNVQLTPGLMRFAEGGIVTSPVQGMVGEAGPEAIIPLTGARGREALRELGGGGQRGDVHIHLHVAGSIQTRRDLVADLARPLRDEFNRLQRNGGAS